ncbi:MAG: terpene cyclase/mutase family protein [Chitinivibrionia bacterium]|nr:terpene cyclase/mutase family protein [Chitinivibrionia bacterium]
MMRRMIGWLGAIFLIPGGMVLAAPPDVDREPLLTQELRQQAEDAVDRGLKYLRSQQEKDGSWSHSVGITALAVGAFMESPRKYREEDGPFIRKPLEYIAGQAKPDGAIYDQGLEVYTTTVCLMTLRKSGSPKYRKVVEKAQSYLVKVQSDEGEGYDRKDKFYGGIGYGMDERPDLSNLQWALEALKSADLPVNAPTWEKAIQFVQRAQNRSESNDQTWAVNDGGFVYYPGNSKAGGTRSYGSMTYAGLLSFIYANVDKDDPRVQAANRWVREHYTVDENPMMGDQGLFYYYHTFAKALKAYGEPFVVDAAGNRHNWREDLARKLISLQQGDGSWVNRNGRWWESEKNLVTAYTVLALSYVLE